MKRVSLRLPDELHARLVQSADTNRRSLHAEILTAIDRYTEEEIPMAKTTIPWTLADEGTDREAYTATRNGWRLTVYWDDQDPANEGWAWRARHIESGDEYSDGANSLDEAKAEAAQYAE